MACEYYTKAGFFKRLGREKGFCEIQKCTIFRDEEIGKISYRYCECTDGKSNTQCGVYAHFAEKEKNQV